MHNTTYSGDERRARLETAKAELTAAVEAISTSEQGQAFLSFAGKLHHYSAGNRFWLFQQSLVRGWEDLGPVAGFTRATRELPTDVISGHGSSGAKTTTSARWLYHGLTSTLGRASSERSTDALQRPSHDA